MTPSERFQTSRTFAFFLFVSTILIKIKKLFRRKVLALLPFVLFCFSGNAQMKSLFYGQSWSDVSKLSDSISSATHMRLDSSSMTKSGKAQTLFFSDGSGNSLEVSIFKGNPEADKIRTVSMYGSKEAVLALYGIYFSKEIKEASIMPLQLSQLANGQSLPVTCYQDTRRPDKWILASKNPY